ncbi:unnamed protein product [Rotaria sp. Silwood1]|nr:unnamed protein product [Rotaria sp. Silwood1]
MDGTLRGTSILKNIFFTVVTNPFMKIEENTEQVHCTDHIVQKIAMFQVNSLAKTYFLNPIRCIALSIALTYYFRLPTKENNLQRNDKKLPAREQLTKLLGQAIPNFDYIVQNELERFVNLSLQSEQRQSSPDDRLGEENISISDSEPLAPAILLDVSLNEQKQLSTLESWNGNLTWPNSSFMPHAVDISNNFGIIAGFIQNDPQGRVKYSPIIYLLNFNSSNHPPIVVDQYIPIATPSTWQDLLTYSDVNIYSAKYDMSISINSRGDVLVGMQFINRVFLFSVNISNPTQLIYINRNTNGRSLGNGKSLAWLDNENVAAILINTYSLNYQWSSSQIYLYDMKSNVYNSNSTPISIFPNYHQVLPQSFSPVFLNIVSSPISLTLMDHSGNLLIFTPTSTGFYPSIPTTGSKPLITSPQPCPPGMYKDQVGINDCILCPTGTKNSGNATTQCTPCALDAFCPLGSVSEISSSALENIAQLIAYPKSPESTIFDEVLLQNMFHIGTGRCLLVSPLFWTLIVGGLAILIAIVIKLLKYFVDHTTYVRIKNRTHYIFKKTDLIGEGELWVGGLASFAVVVLVSFAYGFSNSYYKQYPIETSTDSYFACDLSTRNAKFQTSLQALGIPPSKNEKKMFDLLNEQSLSGNIWSCIRLVQINFATNLSFAPSDSVSLS